MTEVATYRQRKDAFFKDDAHSPFKDKGFLGLSYYEETPAFVTEVSLILFDSMEFTDLATSIGDIQTYRQFARAEFELAGAECSLTFYRSIGEEERLFVPFKDLSNETTTYAAGRYLDVLWQPDETVVLDFNYAYNPLCAYVDGYRCPYPPAENQLQVFIAAGEKRYGAA